MLGTFATKASTDVFDGATIETQSPGSDQGSLGGQIRTHALEQALDLLRGSESTVNDALPQHLDGSGKTDAIGVQALGLSRLPHQAADGIMGQQQGVELLQDQLGRATAQGLLAEALLISGLVDGLFNFPAFVRAQTQRLGGSLLGGEQGGDEPMDLAHLRIGAPAGTMHARGGHLLELLGDLRVNEVLNDAHLQRSRQALAILRVQGRQVAAIGQDLLFVGKDALGQPTQHMGSARANGLHQGTRDEAPIHQHEHAGFERWQQAAGQAHFGGLAGRGNDLDDGMGAGFDQVEATQLGVRTARFALGDAPKILGIGGRIIDIFQRAIHGHQAQAKGKSTGCVLSGQRHAEVLHEGAQEAHPELFAPIGPSGARGQRFGFLFCQPSFGTTQLEEDGTQAVAHIQVPTDEHPDDQRQRQLAHPRGLATVGLDEVLDARARKELFQDGPRKGVTEFVFTGQLRYSKGHEESPFDIPDDAFFLRMSDTKLLFHLFKRYCPQGSPPNSAPPPPLRYYGAYRARVS